MASLLNVITFTGSVFYRLMNEIGAIVGMVQLQSDHIKQLLLYSVLYSIFMLKIPPTISSFFQEVIFVEKNEHESCLLAVNQN